MEEYIARDRTVSLWIIALSLVTIMVTWILASPQWMIRQIAQEETYLADVYGEETSRQIVRNSAMVGAMFYRVLTGWMSTHKTTQWGRERGNVARLQLTWIMTRLQSALWTAFYLIPILLAALADGLTQRALAKAQDEYINPVRYQVGFYFLHTAGLLPFVLLAVPVALHPMFFAIYWLLLAAGLYTATKYLHHRI